MKIYFLVASAAVVVAARGVIAADWDVSRTIKESNALLRQSFQEQQFQTYLQQVAYHAEHYPDSPPPQPGLSDDPWNHKNNIRLINQYKEFAQKWDEEQIRRKAEVKSINEDFENLPAEYRETWQNLPAQPASSEAELDAAFQQQIVESRAKRDRVYPEALEPNHPIHEEAEKIWKNIEETGHALLNDPDAPFKVYEMAALRLGIKPTGQP